MAVDWTPTTAQVAVYVPWLTVDSTQPGSQTYLLDFTGNTVPNLTAALSHIADAVTRINTGLGLPTMPDAIKPMATVTAAILAAATLARSYARSDRENELADALAAQAAAALIALTAAADNAGAALSSARPVLIAPEPVYWGDELL